MTTRDPLPGRSDEDFLVAFAQMSAFGATSDGGVDRQALTEPDIAQRRWFARLLESFGFRVGYDEIGNQFGLLELVPGAPYVLTGSHMDSQPTAGRFDGAYGVLASAFAASRVAGSLSPGSVKRNIAVVNWFNEEGSRFAPSMMGSAVYTGVLPLEIALATEDRKGVSVEQALSVAALTPPVPAFDISAYAEIHVEQGRLLEDAGVPIGLVTATWAARKYRFIVHGAQAHSGATVMIDRRDALLGAAMLIIAAREIADAFPGAVHTAVGQLDVYPNSPVVVASEVTLLLDIRAGDEASARKAARMLDERVAEIEDAAKVSIARVLTHSWGINPYQPDGVQLARAAAERIGMEATDILTVAGHDSVNLKALVPTVMLFVPSVAGVSHNTNERTDDEDLISGVLMLTEVLDDLARGALVRGATT